MRTINCIAIDDEIPHLQIIEAFVNKIQGLKLVSSFVNVLEAAEVIKNQDIHLMFLDIEMEPIRGIDFLRMLKEPPVTIITTAHEQFAVEGFNLDAADYLVKPFSYERFLMAVEKAFRRLDQVFTSDTTNIPEHSNYSFFRTGNQYVKVDHDEILFVEAMDDHVKVHTFDKVLVPNKLYLKTIETQQLLPTQKHTDLFIRISRSFIVSTNKIKAVNGKCHSVQIGQRTIPVGESFRKELMHRLHLNLH